MQLDKNNSCFIFEIETVMDDNVPELIMSYVSCSRPVDDCKVCEKFLSYTIPCLIYELLVTRLPCYIALLCLSRLMLKVRSFSVAVLKL